MAELITLLHRSDVALIAESLSRLCPRLSLTTTAAGVSEVAIRSPFDTNVRKDLRKDGFIAVRRVLGAAESQDLAIGIAALRAARLPATLIYAFDEIWQLGEAVRWAVGPSYRIAADVWAWHIEPGKGRGWAPHRGLAEPVFDRAAPELLNTWVALSDVEVDRACMHFVPLDEDPAYPDQLASIDVPHGKGVAAPLAAGDALMWNANTLHWGGECAETARGPRVSCSFSLVREDAVERVGIPLADPLPRTLEERLDLIARQIVVYGEGQPDVRPEVLEWARASVFLAMYRPVTQRKAP